MASCSSNEGNTPSPSGGSASTTADLGPSDPGGGGIRFVASGEALALTGYPFPPSSGDDVVFVDGWQVKFSRLLVTVDNLTLAESPDRVAGDPSKIGGLAARIAGPWAIDLAHADATSVAGKGGPDERAVPFASIKTNALRTDGTRYAFGFDVVPASANAKRVNVTGDAAADYAEMITNGCTVLYVGAATFKGDKSDPACYPADRQGWPDIVNFRLCFKTPTTYANCQNPDNDPARPLADEEHQRGVALKESTSVIAQVTMHTDHPFWDSVIHDSPPHFDPLAARVVGVAGVPTVTLDDLKGVDYTGITDATGKPLTWRYCTDPATDAHAKFAGPMRFFPASVPHATSPDPTTGLRDVYDLVSYNQSTQGHLNADGLCAVTRNYPSPK